MSDAPTTAPQNEIETTPNPEVDAPTKTVDEVPAAQPAADLPEDLTPDEPVAPHRTPAADQVPDMDEPGTLQRAGSAVAEAAKGAGTSFMEGLHAMRAVHEAAQKSDDARQQIEQMQEALENDRDELSHRTQIEMDYDRLSKLLTATINTARTDAQAARGQIDAATAKKDELDGQLTQMKAAHEEKLSPYRTVMESSKGRSDDTSRALAEARRAVKTAEGQAADAANRAVDAAQDRLRRAQAELDRIQRDPSASPNALSKLRSEAVAERAHVDAAKVEVVSVTNDTKQAVDNAQTHLWTAKQSLETAERQANEAKAEANARKEEFDSLYKKAMAEEDVLKKQIADCEARIKDATSALKDAGDREQDAQAQLDEANDIHSTPEITAQLKQRILETQKALAAQTAEADKLAGYEQDLRHSTRKKRIIFIAMAVAIVVVVLLILFFIVKPK